MSWHNRAKARFAVKSSNPTASGRSGNSKRFEKVQLVHLVGSLQHGGTEELVFNLLTRLDRDLFEPEVWVLAASNCREEVVGRFERQGIRVKTLCDRWHRTRVAHLWREFMRRKLDIVHTHHYDANYYGRLAAILARVPIIMTYDHNLPIDERAHHRLTWRILNIATSTNVTVSNSVARYRIHECGVPAAKVVVVRNGIDVHRFKSGCSIADRREARQALGIPQEGIIVGSVGRLVGCKRHDLVLRAVAYLRERPDIRVLIVGEGPERQSLGRLARELGIANRVEFLGWTNRVEKAYQAMDVFLMLSENEGFGLVSAEAMASMIPIVAADEPIHREIITAECGIFVESNPSAVANGIALLLDNPAKATRLAFNARRRAMEEFNIDRTAAELQALYQRALQMHK